MKVKEKENLLNEISSFKKKLILTRIKLLLDFRKEKLEDKLEKLKQAKSYLINEDVDTKKKNKIFLKEGERVK